MLYLIATPIGNLEDITLRALSVLKSCDYVLAEDTRKTQILLSHFKISKKCISFQKFSEKKQEAKVLADLQNDKNIALLSDAGTPLISDPGESLVKACIKQKLPLTALPGACSPINALVLSGFQSIPFQFRGFLKRKAGELKKQILQMLSYSGTSIAFESPHRLIASLKLLQKLDPERKISVAREMTKMFEESVQGTAEELIEYFSDDNHPLKGEIVLLMEEKEYPLENNNENDPNYLELEELLTILKEKFSLTNKEALKLAAKILKTKKNVLYKKSL